MQVIDVGDTWPILTSWWDEDREDAEPSTIDMVITAPDGTTETVTKADMTSPDEPPAVLSHWVYPLDVSLPGVWQVVATADVGGFPVVQSLMFLAGEASMAGGPCSPWNSWDDVTALCTTDDVAAALAQLPNATRSYLLDVATWVLFSLTGRKYPGVCTTSRRVCLSCVVCRGGCSCLPTERIDLSGGRYPVHGIISVVIDGEPLDPSAYQLLGRRWLVRTDGQAWPRAQDLTDPSAFVVTFPWGRLPNVGLRHAGARFTFEMAKKCAPGRLRCELPERVTTITRENVTYTVIDSQRFLEEGRTGIYEVDLMLTADRDATTAKSVRPGGYSPMVG